MEQNSIPSPNKHLEYPNLSKRVKTKIEKNRGKPLVCNICLKPIEAGEPVKFSSKHRHCYHASCYESMLIK